jgi:pimeloyl-ACP methyl ester carboxylesterase
MADSDPTTHMLDVPGARLYYERRGRGPLLLLIGSPMDSGGFAPLASALADRYTVVTYDPRGIANSSREDTTEDVTPAQQAEDVHRLLSALGGGPADVFGSSGGAVVGLALVTAHPDQLRTLVAHEPPLVELLADAARLRAEIQNVYDTYRVEGAEKAMQKFLAHAGLGAGAGQQADAPRWEPSPEQLAQMRATTDQFLAHLLRPTTRYRPDIEALRGGVDADRGRRRGHLQRAAPQPHCGGPGRPARDDRGRLSRRPWRIHGLPGAVRPRPRPGADRKDLSRRLRCKLRSRGRVAGAVGLHARLPPCRRFVGGRCRCGSGDGCLEVKCGEPFFRWLRPA